MGGFWKQISLHDVNGEVNQRKQNLEKTDKSWRTQAL